MTDALTRATQGTIGVLLARLGDYEVVHEADQSRVVRRDDGRTVCVITQDRHARFNDTITRLIALATTTETGDA